MLLSLKNHKGDVCKLNVEVRSNSKQKHQKVVKTEQKQTKIKRNGGNRKWHLIYQV